MQKTNLIYKAYGVVLLAVVGVFLLGNFGAISVTVLLSFNCLLLVVVGSMGVTLLSADRQTCEDFYLFITFRGQWLSTERRQELIKMLAAARRAGYALGAIGVLMGLILVLIAARLGQVGPGVALALIALLYAVAWGELGLAPMCANLARPRFRASDPGMEVEFDDVEEEEEKAEEEDEEKPEKFPLDLEDLLRP